MGGGGVAASCDEPASHRPEGDGCAVAVGDPSADTGTQPNPPERSCSLSHFLIARKLRLEELGNLPKSLLVLID